MSVVDLVEWWAAPKDCKRADEWEKRWVGCSVSMWGSSLAERKVAHSAWTQAVEWVAYWAGW